MTGDFKGEEHMIPKIIFESDPADDGIITCTQFIAALLLI